MEQQQIIIQMALHAWNIHVKRTEKFLDALTDEQLEKEIAPGKNRITYLIGHLVAVNDNMISLFGMGERSYAFLDEAFVKMPDRAIAEVPGPSALRDYWRKSNEQLTALFNQIPADIWFARHTAMTDEDYIKEPTRNKLAVLINRTNHLAYHLGQMLLVKGE